MDPRAEFDHSLPHYDNLEEHEAALDASILLALIVEDYYQGEPHVTEEQETTDEDDWDWFDYEHDQFLYGQDFDVEPEVWDLPESWFQIGGPCGPRDLRDL